MLESTYTAYDGNGNTVKAGTVAYEEGATDNETAMNFGEAVIAEVGEERFENEIAGIRD